MLPTIVVADSEGYVYRTLGYAFDQLKIIVYICCVHVISTTGFQHHFNIRSPQILLTHMISSARSLILS